MLDSERAAQERASCPRIVPIECSLVIIALLETESVCGKYCRQKDYIVSKRLSPFTITHRVRVCHWYALSRAEPPCSRWAEVALDGAFNLVRDQKNF